MIAVDRRSTSASVDCAACGHASRLHGAEGCIATRCDCWLRLDQVRLTGSMLDDLPAGMPPQSVSHAGL
jgi:hypothetical protein